MNRSLPLNRSQSTRDLTVGVIGAIVSLSVTLLQHLNGHDSNNSTALLQAMEQIQHQLAKLIRRLKVTRQRHAPRLSAGPRRPLNTTLPTVATLNATLPRVAPLDATFQTLNRTLPTVAPLNATLPRVAPLDSTFATAGAPRNAPGVNTTFPAPPANRTLPTPEDYRVPPGYREISNLEDWIDESSTQQSFSQVPELSVTNDLTPEGLEWSHDANYYPEMNQIIADLEASGEFNPPMSSTSPELDVTFDRGAAILGGPAPNVVPLPRRVAELRGTGRLQRSLNQSLQRSPPQEPRNYQVRESNNTRNLDGSLSHVSRTVSGPDVSNVGALNISLPPFQTSKSK